MSKKIIKIHDHEAAINFTAERGIEVIMGGKPFNNIEMARIFAICYAITNQPRLYEIFRQVLRQDFIIQKNEEIDLNKRSKIQTMIDLLTVKEVDEADTIDTDNLPKTASVTPISLLKKEDES